jgi:hypothetical protein
MHNDLWFWDNPTLVFGIPIGLFYHIIYCFVASVLLWSLIKYAWPDFVAKIDKETGNAQNETH